MKEKIGFGVIGAGLWGSVHAEIYASHPCAELVAVCDSNRARADEVAGCHGVRSYTDYREMLADPAVEAVAVVTPDFAHKDAIIAAAKAGKHIITEKPLATMPDEVGEIARVVRDAGISFMVDFHARWNPPIAIARQNIEDGTLGNIVSAYVRLNDTISVPTSMLSWASRSSILWFLGSHTIDILRFLFDDEVERVYSVSSSGILKARGIDVPDLYQSILEFKKGAVATIENNWIIPNTNPAVNDFKINVLGSKGMINMDLTNNQLIERYLETKSDHPDCIVKPKVWERHYGFAYESIRDFVDRLWMGKPPRVGLDDGVRVSEVVFAIMESALKREPVKVRYSAA